MPLCVERRAHGEACGKRQETRRAGEGSFATLHHTFGGALATRQSPLGHGAQVLYRGRSDTTASLPLAISRLIATSFKYPCGYIYKLLKLPTVHSISPRPVPNLTCDCLLELSVRVLCFIDNITCMTSRAQAACKLVLWMRC